MRINHPALLMPLLILAASFPACGAAETALPTAATDTPMTIPSSTPAPTLTYTPQATTARQKPTAVPSRAPTITATHVPDGVFVLKFFYTPLVMDYDPAVWSDESQYANDRELINHLQHKTLESCMIGVRGPNGWYPEGMQTVILGIVEYQMYQGMSDRGTVLTDYFALRAVQGSIDNEWGIPILEVHADPTEAEDCNNAAEAVLGTLRVP